MNTGEGVWLYAITSIAVAQKGSDLEDLTNLKGVAGESIRTVRHGDLIAVVGTVSLDRYGEAAMKHNVEDLDWLAATARTHDTVVGTLSRERPTLPLRLATLYLDDDRVRELLERNAERFRSALGAVAGRSEWGVKIYADETKLLVAQSDSSQESTGAGKGTAYLLRRRNELKAKENLQRRAVELASDIDRSLLQYAVDGRRSNPTDPALTGNKAWMISNGTYLVADDDIEEFKSVAQELNTQYSGITLELTGPWPPYSFTHFEE